ncbi:hypothetical protein [Aquimarina sp. 2201CG5-10]|uniref:hypothetical protein n=1 Tax=Aquimarina callyspongiae TaxID=3098150 RepID=UPI002AB408EE|nr:hypothetical protein [Aquimarina sp. 2201CG5-10]MDY8135302.1 hypothetical protein [Aquimarina sp. 2201CG5-10]
MKKYVILFGLLIMALGQLSAQELNTVPLSTLRLLPDGWHKFTEKGAFLDVEVLGGNLVKGNITWFDKSSYSGSFSGNRISGKGTYTWPNGNRYEGSFRNNQRHGKGSMIHSDGSKWSGKWKLNQKNGKGKKYDNQGVVTEEGVWEQDKYIKAKKKK